MSAASVSGSVSHDPSSLGQLIAVGRMTDSGIYQVVKTRGAMAGMPDVFTHQFRHTFAHLWQVNGGNESDLMCTPSWLAESPDAQEVRSFSSRPEGEGGATTTERWRQLLGGWSRPR
jgi:hypothetical protein